MSKLFGAIFLLTAGVPWSAASTEEKPVDYSGDKAAAGSCLPFVSGNITGTISIGLGNRGGFENRTIGFANLTSNQTFQICGGTWHDRTTATVHYNLLNGPKQSEPLAKGSCFLFNAARIDIQAIMGSGIHGGEDSVGGLIKVCNLGS